MTTAAMKTGQQVAYTFVNSLLPDETTVVFLVLLNHILVSKY